MYGAYVKKRHDFFCFPEKKKKDMVSHKQKKTSLYSVVNNKHET